MNESTSIEGVRLTLAQVAEGLGTSPQNLHKTYIKKGKLTVKRDDLDKPYIELIEVLRQFPERFRMPEKKAPVSAVDSQPVSDGLSSNQTALTDVLRKNAELEARIAYVDREKADLREQLREVKATEARLWNQVEKLTDTLALLKGPETPATHPQEAPKQATTDEKKPGLFSRLFGR